MENKKNILYVIVLLLIIIGAFWYVFSLVKPTSQPAVVQSQTDLTDKTNKKVPPPPEIPKFISGTVTRTEKGKVFIQAGGGEKTIITNDKTEIVKQVKVDGIFQNLPATFAEIKSLLQIVVFYGENSGSEYTANKIQILIF